MQKVASQFSALQAAAYLVEAADEYRAIMRFFYLRDCEHTTYVETDEILAYVRRVCRPDYTEELLQHQLDMLVDWGCIRNLPERSRPRSPADMRRKPRVYQAERIVMKLEEARVHAEAEAQARLSPNALDDLVDHLETLVRVMAALVPPYVADQRSRIYRLWHSVHAAFEAFASSTRDYFSDLSRNQSRLTADYARFEERRRRIVEYLNDYARRLYERRDQIRFLLADIRRASGVLADICANEAARDVASDWQVGVGEEEALVRRYEQDVAALSAYFGVGTQSRRCDVDVLLDQAQTWVSEITEHAARLSDFRMGSIQQQALLTLAATFVDLDARGARTEADYLAQVAFASTAPLHWRGVAPPPVERAWVSLAADVELSVVRRGPRQRQRIEGGVDQTAEQLQRMVTDLENREREAHALEILFGPDGTLDMTRLELADPHQRTLLLGLLRRALASEDCAASVGYRDWRIEVRPASAPTGALIAEDGNLYRVPYRLHLRKGVHDSGA